MPGSYYIHVKILSMKGKCPQKHKVGEEWVIGDKTPDGLCLNAFNSQLTHIQVMRYGGIFPWATDNTDTVISTCPDPDNRVCFELKRIKR